MNRKLFLRMGAGILIAGLMVASVQSSSAKDKKIVFFAGRPSHGPGEHEFRAGCLLLQKCLANVPGLQTVVYSNGWPSDPKALDGADALVLAMDGGINYPILKGDRLEQINALMKKGVGLACIHWAVEPWTKEAETDFLDWIGGAYEAGWSVNPTWTADFKTLPDHPITRGVKPFSIFDEWYFHLRFPEDTTGLTPILAAVPPASTMSRPDGPNSGNPAVREAVKNGELETMVWAFQRPDGGRGFGFTGSHYVRNWGNDNFRKIALNGLLWIAHIEVPPNGVESHVTPEELTENLDVKGRKKH